MFKSVLMILFIISMSNAQANSTISEVASRFGITVGGNCTPSEVEVSRFERMLSAYDQLGLIRGTLNYLEFKNAPTNWKYGGRPWANIGKGAIYFYCVTSGWLPSGSLSENIHGLEYYFAHEIGHLHRKNHVDLFQEFFIKHKLSKKENYNQQTGTYGDFITDYASTNLEEDWAETFRTLSHALYGASYMWNRLYEYTATSKVILGEKLALIAKIFLTSPNQGRFLIKVWPDGSTLEPENIDKESFIYVIVSYDINLNKASLIESISLSKIQLDKNFHKIANPSSLLN